MAAPEAFSLEWMVGMATLTMVTSSSAMNWPVISTASISHRRRSGLSLAAGMVAAVPGRAEPGRGVDVEVVMKHSLRASGTGYQERRYPGIGTTWHRGPPHRAGRVPAQPPRADQPRRRRPAAGVAAPHPGAPPRGGRPARRGRGDLVHLARAGPADPRQRAGAGRGRAHAAAGPGRGRAPLPARRDPRGAGRCGAGGLPGRGARDPRVAGAAARDAAERPLRHPRGQPGARRPVLGLASRPGLRAQERAVVLLRPPRGAAVLP